MWSSMVMLIFSVWDWKYPFWAHLVLKITIFSLSWNLVLRLIWICRIESQCSIFGFLTGNTLFGQIWSQNSKSFVYSEIWYPDQCEYAGFNSDVLLFCFRPEIPFLGKFGPKNQKCQFKQKLVPTLIWIYRIET